MKFTAHEIAEIITETITETHKDLAELKDVITHIAESSIRIAEGLDQIGGMLVPSDSISLRSEALTWKVLIEIQEKAKKT